jgi:hypothetical protein
MRRIAALLLALHAAPACAHANFGELAPFWAGALHVLVTPLAMASLLGLACAVVALAEASQFRLALLAGLLVTTCSAAIGWLPGVPGGAALVAAGGALLPALAAALAVPKARAFAIVLVVAAALAVSLSVAPEPGAAVAPRVTALVTALGAGLCVVLVLLWLQEGVRRLGQRLPLAPRVLGAWVAAIAVLLGALQFAVPPR